MTAGTGLDPSGTREVGEPIRAALGRDRVAAVMQQFAHRVEVHP